MFSHLLHIRIVEFDDGQAQMGLSIVWVQGQGTLKSRLSRLHVTKLQLASPDADSHFGRTVRVLAEGSAVMLQRILVLLLVVHDCGQGQESHHIPSLVVQELSRSEELLPCIGDLIL